MPQLRLVSIERRHAYLIGGIPLAFLILLVTAWAIDSATSRDEVSRNVMVGSRPVSGLDRAELRAFVSDQTAALAELPATVTVEGSVIEWDPVSLGARIDEDEFIDEAFLAHRDSFVLFRPFQWFGSFFTTTELSFPYTTDPDAVALAAEDISLNVLGEPVEPTIDFDGTALIVNPGSEGRLIEPETLATGLLTMMNAGEPYAMTLPALSLAPELDDATATALADEANLATSGGLVLQVDGKEASVSSADLRSWVVADTSVSPPTWMLDEATVQAGIQPLFPTLGDASTQAHFTVENNRPVIIPASESLVCCEEDSAAIIQRELMAALPSSNGDGAAAEEGSIGAVPVPLEVRVTDADNGVAALQELGIVEQVAVFTTRHACCENRVKNIQLMADIVRGAIIRPGESFSLNGYVGRRTAERGFLPAGAIAEGVFEDQVGGGVSQFATTIFNAAFEAGLDFNEYQSHSIYISRYPRGREATISWPKPDLKFTNNTDYGILIWPTYTDTTISVTMFSTRNITVTDLGTKDSAQGACTRVTTTRKRVWSDGTEDIDSVYAIYRPAEGINCAGESTRPTTTTTTTVPPETTESTDGGTTEPPTSEETTTTTVPPTTEPPSTEPPTPTSAEGAAPTAAENGE